VDEAELRAVLGAEGVPAAALGRAGATTWGNGPGDRYAPHRHAFDKVLLVLTGSIVFELPEEGRSVRLVAGERFDLPHGVLHAAVVGPTGVRCLELHLDGGSLAARDAAAETAAETVDERGS
jgi:hypothetical protein